MHTYSFVINKKEYLICGDTIRQAVHDNSKYFDKIFEGCTVKSLLLMPFDDGNTEQTEYKLRIEYYNITHYKLNRLRTKPTLHKMVISLFLLD